MNFSLTLKTYYLDCYDVRTKVESTNVGRMLKNQSVQVWVLGVGLGGIL